MFFLTLNAAISNGFTGGARLQLHFVDLRNAAGSANVSRLSVFAVNHHFSLYFHSHQAERSKRDFLSIVALAESCPRLGFGLPGLRQSFGSALETGISWALITR